MINKNKTILITGVAGNIGSALANFLLKDKRNFIIGVDNFNSGFKKNLPKSNNNFVFYNLDVNKANSLKKIFSNYSIDYIYHYAAFVGVDRTLKYPEKVFDDLQGVRNIIEFAHKFKVKKIAYASSSEVYGENAKIPYYENKSPVNPKLPYATVKLTSENMLIGLGKKYGIDCIIFRFFNTYGPAQSDDYVIKRFIIAALNNEPITVYGDGKQKRTFLYITDNIIATTNAFNSKKMTNTIINIGSSKMFTILDLAKKIISITNSNSQLVFKPERKSGDTKIRQPSNETFLELIGKSKLINLETGIRKIIDSISK